MHPIFLNKNAFDFHLIIHSSCLSEGNLCCPCLGNVEFV